MNYGKIHEIWLTFILVMLHQSLGPLIKVCILSLQINKYKELKELVRKKVALLTQQLEKLQWEQRADQEKMSFDQRRKKDIEVLSRICYQRLMGKNTSSSKVIGLFLAFYLFVIANVALVRLPSFCPPFKRCFCSSSVRY